MKRRIYFGDTDPFGVTFFVTYHRIFKEALDEFIQSKGISPELFYRNPNENYAFPITYSEARFFKPTRFYDEIDVETSVKSVEPTKIVFEFKAFKDGDIVAKGTLEVTCIDRKWKRREIPEVIKKALDF
uniref:Acyl-CoA thioesterase n=1 Tax=Geoglobus ahangari TaxID=113653 RepID=A0A7C3UBR2_9EURY